MDFLYEYGLFLAKTVTFVVAVIAIIVAITAAALKQKHKKGQLEVTDLSAEFKEVEQDITHQLLSKEQLKHKEKQDKKQAKEKDKADKKALKDEIGRAHV